jgi:hypothetical protein
MRPCTVCTHPRRGEIDAALLDERPYRSIAEHFGISHLAVFRHKTNHLTVPHTQDSNRRIRDDFDEYANEIFLLFEKAKTKSLPEAFRAAARVESAFRLRLRINALPDDSASERAVTWEEMRPDLEAALRPFPGALDAVARLVATKLGLPSEDLEAEPAPPPPPRKR